MNALHQRRAVSRLWLVMTTSALLAPLVALTGCHKQAEPPPTTGGAVYYTGPKVPKGQAAPAGGR